MNGTFWTATDLVRMIAAREASATEIAEATLERIARVDPSVGAFVTVTEDLALEQAKAVDARLASGDDPGPFAGVPVSIKDLSPVAGIRMTLGSRAFAGFVAPYDSFVVAKMRSAGGVFLGKTNTSEAGAAPLTSNDVAAATRNPWDPSRSTGGSSGGAAAAVAAGLGPVAEGSDGGGSIRIPASCCGVVGLKPSRGRVSAAPAMGEPWGGMATAGTLARTVEDAALLLDVMAGPATGDPYWAPPPAAPFRVAARTDPGRLRIAFATSVPEAATDPEVAAVTEVTATLLESLGHTVEPGCPSFAGMAAEQFTIASTGIASALAEMGVDDELLTPFVRLMRANGATKSGMDYTRALRQMHTLSRRVVAFFDDYDVLLTPTLTSPAPPLEWFPEPVESAKDEFYRWLAFTYPFNMTGQPAISIPGGRTAAGLPVGVQLVGRPAAEATIISLAAQLEQAAPWRDRVPAGLP